MCHWTHQGTSSEREISTGGVNIYSIYNVSTGFVLSLYKL